MTLPTVTDSRYWDPKALNFSSLARFVSYDYQWIPSYNIYNYLNPPPWVDTEATLIWTIVDQVFTEGLDFEETYTKEKWKTVEQLKEILMPYVEERWLKVSTFKKKQDWEDFFAEIFPDAPEDNRIVLTPAVYDKIVLIIDSHFNFQYSKDETILQLFSRSEKQKVVENNGRKGKLDFYLPWLIMDMKIVGNLDTFLKDFQYKGNYQIHHRYVRQMAFYSDLLWWNHDAQLIVTDHSGTHNVLHIPNSILVRAQALNDRDVTKLRATLESDKLWTTFGIPDEFIPAWTFMPWKASPNDPFENM